MNGLHGLSLLLIVICLLLRLLPLGPDSRRVVPGEGERAGSSGRVVYLGAEAVGVGEVVSVVVCHLNNIVVISEPVVELLDQLDEQLRVQRVGYLHQDLGLLIVVEHPAVLGLDEVVGQHAGEAVLVHLLDVLVVYAAGHVLLLNYEPAVGGAQLHHLLAGLLDVGLQVGLAAEVVEDRGALPGEGAAVLAEVALAVEALVEGVEEAAVEDLVEALEQLELVLEDDRVGLVEVLRHLYDNGALLELPEGVEDAVGNHHHVGLVLRRLGLLGLLLAGLVHVPQHFQGGRASRHLQVAEDVGLLSGEILDQAFEEELDLGLAGREALFLLVALELADLGLEGKREGLEGLSYLLGAGNVSQHLHQEGVQDDIGDCFCVVAGLVLRIAFIGVRSDLSLHHFNLQLLGSAILDHDFWFGMMVQLKRRVRPPELRAVLLFLLLPQKQALLLSQAQPLLLSPSLLIVVLLLHPAQLGQLRLQLLLGVDHVKVVGRRVTSLQKLLGQQVQVYLLALLDLLKRAQVFPCAAEDLLRGGLAQRGPRAGLRFLPVVTEPEDLDAFAAVERVLAQFHGQAGHPELLQQQLLLALGNLGPAGPLGLRGPLVLGREDIPIKVLDVLLGVVLLQGHRVLRGAVLALGLLRLPFALLRPERPFAMVEHKRSLELQIPFVEF